MIISAGEHINKTMKEVENFQPGLKVLSVLLRKTLNKKRVRLNVQFHFEYFDCFFNHSLHENLR